MAQIDSKILGRGCRTVTNPGCWLFSPNLKVEKKKSQKNTSPGQSWESQVVGLWCILGSGIWMWGQSKKKPKKPQKQPSGVCSWGTLPFARDLLALPHPLFSLFPSFPPFPTPASLRRGGQGRHRGVPQGCRQSLSPSRLRPNGGFPALPAAPCCHSGADLFPFASRALCLICTRELTPYGAKKKKKNQTER